jgi:NACHT domain
MCRRARERLDGVPGRTILKTAFDQPELTQKMNLQPDQLSLKPKTFPLKHVRADVRKLLLSLGEAAAQAKIGEFGNALSALFKTAEAVEIKRPPDELAWVLVRGGLARALAELLRFDDEQGLPAIVYDGDREQNQTEILIERADLAITRDFFKNPAALPIVQAVERTLARWLRFLQPNEPNAPPFNESRARSLAARLRGYFPLALHDEWRAHREHYQPLFDHFDTPFAHAVQMAWDWERNRLGLIKQMDEPVFEETFGLRQVYVPLRAYTLEEIEHDELSGEGRSRRCQLNMLDKEINAWLENSPKAGDDIRLITGGPGSGKSTSAKWLAAELSEKGRMRVLFIPLQRVRIQASLKEAIASYLTETKRFQRSPLAQEGFASISDPLLLIFDGLDELTKPGDLADEQTKRFIEELRHHLGLWNEGGVRVLALITGRTVYAQANRPLLRIADRQEIAVLPYLIDEDGKDKLCHGRKVVGKELLENDQREQWWRSYSVAKGLEKRSLPEVFKINHDLRELTADPLLNYLVVLSGFHKDLESDTDLNRNRIYARLLKDVLDRRHAKRAQTDKVALAAVEETKDRNDFERLLETVALAAWYGDGRTTTRADIEKVMPKDLSATWQELVTNGPGFTRLIAAFYIGRIEGSGTSDAIEFTHKSFGEYLTARRLVREIGRISNGRRVSADYYSERQALEEWAKLTSTQAMTMDLLRFLRDEAKLRSEDEVVAWQRPLPISSNSSFVPDSRSPHWPRATSAQPSGGPGMLKSRCLRPYIAALRKHMKGSRLFGQIGMLLAN